MKYILVTDSTAAEVEARTGMRGHATPLGALVEDRKPVNMSVAMAELDRAMNPNRCICGRNAIVHMTKCPAWGLVT